PKGSTVFIRRSLVTFQFLTAQVLIIGAIVVVKQMHYINSKPLGFQKEQIVDIALPGNKQEQLESFRSKLNSIPGIANFSYSLGAPISDNGFGADFNRKEKYTAERLNVEVKVADKAYQETYGLHLVAGRWFTESDERKVDRLIPDSLRQYSVVINETAVKSLGFVNPEDALGHLVTFSLNSISAPVIGVMKDYHVASLHAPVSPVLMVPYPFFYYNAGIKLSTASSGTTLTAIEKAFSEVYPNDLFEANFLDEHIAKQYKEEKRTVQLLNLFTLVSILINALGLIGLLSFMIQQKTKEIGIRKVLGATVSDISFILSKDFLQLIGIAFVIAVPFAWYLMNKWLEDFAYRTTVSWWVFGLAGMAAILVTCIAVGFQTLKASRANPVKSLRSE
ncbi:MAG: ABC transporter permease, partial [Chitinophagaceae bacterium]